MVALQPDYQVLCIVQNDMVETIPKKNERVIYCDNKTVAPISIRFLDALWRSEQYQKTGENSQKVKQCARYIQNERKYIRAQLGEKVLEKIEDGSSQGFLCMDAVGCTDINAFWKVRNALKHIREYDGSVAVFSGNRIYSGCAYLQSYTNKQIRHCMEHSKFLWHSSYFGYNKGWYGRWKPEEYREHTLKFFAENIQPKQQETKMRSLQQKISFRRNRMGELHFSGRELYEMGVVPKVYKTSRGMRKAFEKLIGESVESLEIESLSAFFNGLEK
jgi:hypothetical protein